MTTETGIAHCIARLGQCPDLRSLRKVWDGLAFDYQRHPTVAEFKEKMKANLS